MHKRQFLGDYIYNNNCRKYDTHRWNLGGDLKWSQQVPLALKSKKRTGHGHGINTRFKVSCRVWVHGAYDHKAGQKQSMSGRFRVQGRLARLGLCRWDIRAAVACCCVQELTGQRRPRPHSPEERVQTKDDAWTHCRTA